jgi:hypothetical protein
MGIVANFKTSDVQKRFDNFLNKIVKQQINYLKKLGEMCVNHARSVPADVGFTDQTGNLRSSIGYTVFVDGVAVSSNYKQVLKGNDGIKKGKELAEKIGTKQKGVCLVVTAGMNYALKVESKGRDVISSAEHLAQQELPKMLNQLISNIRKA